ncbi:hypothetical protein CDAR_294511 [Caerostris darwini]|uniref:Uncharacterized protein n=1 Tax=Caerostris darwini TaxID=1538125 RepID=A0AAV4UKG7_9ARAC|nr:hypothetical protein CDAR_294511 [Caerostris darwini]
MLAKEMLLLIQLTFFFQNTATQCNTDSFQSEYEPNKFFLNILSGIGCAVPLATSEKLAFSILLCQLYGVYFLCGFASNVETVQWLLLIPSLLPSPFILEA